jgi:hypothetical protein
MDRYARRVSGLLMAVDYGTVNTVAVLRRPDGQTRPLLFDGSPLVPSAACVGPDGRLLVGRDAESAGRVDPAAFVADPRSRIDAGTVVLGCSAFPLAEVIGATLAVAAREAIRGAGGVLPRLVLAHPATWDETRLATFTDAGARAGLGVPTLVPTPVAAAWYQAESAGGVEPGRCVLVYHLGVGTFEVSLLRRAAQQYELVAARGLDDVGGVDLDALLIDVVATALPPGAAEAWQRLITPTTTADMRRFTHLCDEVRAAKEALSRQLTVTVHVPLVDEDVPIDREAFESAAEPLLARTVDLAADLLDATGTPLDRVGEVLLLGGSSRIPLVATLLNRRFGVSPTAGRQPEFAVAEGALIATVAVQSAPSPSTVSPSTVPPSTLPPAAAEEPVTPPVASPVATGPVAEPVAEAGTRRPPVRLLAVAAGLACALVLAGLFAMRPSPFPASGGVPGLAGTRPGATGPGADALASVPATGAPIGPAPGASPPTTGTSSVTPSSTATPADTPAPTSPAPTSGTGPVLVTVTANPTDGTCSTNITFTAHFTVNSAAKYRWHWVFGGINNYSFSSGDQNLDKTGDVHIARKFDGFGSGPFWGQVVITSPVALTSNQATVDIVCLH